MSNTGTIEDGFEELDELTMALHSAITNLLGFALKDMKTCDFELVEDLKLILESLQETSH